MNPTRSAAQAATPSLAANRLLIYRWQRANLDGDQEREKQKQERADRKPATTVVESPERGVADLQCGRLILGELGDILIHHGL